MLTLWIRVLLAVLPALLQYLFSLRKSAGQFTGTTLDSMNKVTTLCLQVSNASMKVGCTRPPVNLDGQVAGDKLWSDQVGDTKPSSGTPLWLVIVLVAAAFIGGGVAGHFIKLPNILPIPAPVDPFVESLSAAYKIDQGTDKAASKDALVALFRQAATSQVMRPELKSTGDVLSMMHAAATGMIGDKLAGVRQELASYFDNALSQDNTALTPELRKKIADVFLTVADVLGKVK